MVAAAAGVSRGTASRALNGLPNVSPRALEAVRRAARELDYRPNLNARSLVTGRTGLVGLVVNESDDRVFADPYFATVLRGAHDALSQAGAALVLTLVADERERDRLFDMVAARLDGLVVVYGHGDTMLRTGLRATGAPVVYAGRTPSIGDSDESWVDSDSLHGAMTAVEHLLGRGSAPCRHDRRSPGDGGRPRPAGRLAPRPARRRHRPARRSGSRWAHSSRSPATSA